MKGKLIDVRGRVYRDGPNSNKRFNPDPVHVNDRWYSDFDGDAWNNLETFDPPKPSPHAGPLRPHRKAVADATRFFRNFNRSSLRPLIYNFGQNGRERADILEQAVEALGGLPTLEDMNQAGEVLALGMKPGDKFDPTAFAILVGASKYWNRVPEGLTYLVRRRGDPIVVPSDEPEFNCKLGTANILEIPREMLWMDDDLFYEAYSRNALTKFEWDKRIWEPTYVKVAFIVDVSGSMGGEPILIAAACALKLGKLAEENGHEVKVVFFATQVSKEYTPSEAFKLKELHNLGGGTNIEGAVLKTQEVTKPDAYVLVSDFQVHNPTERAKELLACKDAEIFGLLPCPHKMAEDSGKEQLSKWVPEPSKRLKIRTY